MFICSRLFKWGCAMKKLIISFCVILNLFAAPTVLFGKDNFVPFSITTGELSGGGSYSTVFEKDITLVASSIKGAVVDITVEYDAKLNLDPVVYDSVTVGASNIFSKNIRLNLGENNIKIRVAKDDYDKVYITHVVKRETQAKKTALTGLIVIP